MEFKVQLFSSEEGVAVCAPGLPGCWSQGDTEEEALADIAAAIREYLEAGEDAATDPETRSEVREIEVSN